MRLVDADTFDVISTKIPDGVDADSYIAGIAYVVSKIDAQPTIEERKTGKWLPDNTSMYEIRFVCSNCKESQVVPTIGYKPKWDWCPNCGADMREQP